MEVVGEVFGVIEISEKVQKFLITSLPAGRQGLWNDYTDTQIRNALKIKKICLIVFEICVIKRAYSGFSELSNYRVDISERFYKIGLTGGA
jgi:hypothetical protein